MAATPALEVDDPSAVLAAARFERSIADQAEANLLRLAVDWAAMHSTDSIEDAACFGDGSLTRFSGHGWCGDHAAPWSAV